MSNLTINPNAKNNKQMNVALLNESKYGKGVYAEVIKWQQGSLTQVYISDVISVYKEAALKFCTNEFPLQQAALQKFAAEHYSIAKTIDPARLDFTITKATDDEICINRIAATGGKVKIIIHDDGLIAFSYLPAPAFMMGNEKELLIFQDLSEVDIEAMLYRFFSY